MPGFQQGPLLWLPLLSAIKQRLPMDRGSKPRDKSWQTAALQLEERDAGEQRGGLAAAQACCGLGLMIGRSHPALGFYDAIV